MVPDTTTEVAGPKTPPHFCEAPVSIPPFDLALIGMLAAMSPITEGENALLNLAPGSPVNSMAAAGIGNGTRGSGQSSCSNSPMSLGSQAVSSSIRIALRIRARAATPALFESKESSTEEDSHKEEMDAAIKSARDGEY